MSTDTVHIDPPDSQRPRTFKIVLIVVAITMLTSLLTVWLATAYLFPREFKPVKLNDHEAQVLNAKLALLEPGTGSTERAPGKQLNESNSVRSKRRASPTPERYNEADASRLIRLSERELNALLARNTNLAHKLAIDLSEDLASAKLLIHLNPDLPFLGGKTLRVTAGLELRYENRNPVVMLKGVSIWRIPMPNAWLGGIKNVDLVKQFGTKKGFWHAFAAGVENIRVEEGSLSIQLRE